jgi:hypothetical protein
MPLGVKNWKPLPLLSCFSLLFLVKIPQSEGEKKIIKEKDIWWQKKGEKKRILSFNIQKEKIFKYYYFWTLIMEDNMHKSIHVPLKKPLRWFENINDEDPHNLKRSHKNHI